jgi:transposase
VRARGQRRVLRRIEVLRACVCRRVRTRGGARPTLGEHVFDVSVRNSEDNRYVDRESLDQLLQRGVSLAEIGRRFGRHESTIAYWVRKYGLEAPNKTSHAPKGGLRRSELEPLVTAGLSIAEIASAVGRSATTVRHWLRKYGLATRQTERLLEISGHEDRISLDCPLHGRTLFRRRQEGGYRCLKCRAEAVARRRRVVKNILVTEAGGACAACGYDRYVRALHFHHLHPPDKRFSLAERGVARSLAKARREAQKCVLLCSHCHAEIEAGLLDLPMDAHLQCSDVSPEDHPG